MMVNVIFVVKKAIYSSKGEEEYCDKHAEEAIEWYYKQIMDK